MCRIMSLVYIVALFHIVSCVFVRLDIKSFSIEMVTEQNVQDSNESDWNAGKFREYQQVNQGAASMEHQMRSEKKCLYQYPEQKDINRILSDMLNQLARVFVKADVFISKQVEKHTRKFWNADLIRRALQTRFKIATDRRKQFFDNLFSNMTQEYRKFLNITGPARGSRSVSAGSEGEACAHDADVRRQWRALLQHSLRTLSRATHSCARAFLREQRVAPQSQLARKLVAHVRREMGLIRGKQLRALCDTYRVCFGDQLDWPV